MNSSGKRPSNSITIIGGGLAGSEAAYQAAKSGLRVAIREMKPMRFSPAHSMDGLAELVCSNSLKAVDLAAASGILKDEMARLGSIVITAAYETRVAAGGTLAVDRGAFSEFVTQALLKAGVEIIREEAVNITEEPAAGPLVIATGPLTSDAFASAISSVVGAESCYFYDAVAPIVYRDSINMDRVFHASRYGKGGNDYINCPLDKGEYERFVAELLSADRPSAHAYEDLPLFAGCMPIEAMAQRGPMTLMFGPMKPVGLVDPRTGARPYAAVQLRSENRDGTLYNIVGFQTRLGFKDQQRVFRLIPGLENAEFARLGKMHRNTYIDSPRLLMNTQQLKANPMIFFAGQITGVEGYCESAVSGIMAGINAARLAKGLPLVCPPPTTVTGALLRHVSSCEGPFQPMNANLGLLPPLEKVIKRKCDRKAALAQRAIEDFDGWLKISGI